MRVISGKYKGKKLNGFDIMGTRPTMDRVKESLFAIIQNKILNSNCLDLFAGSGSLGIEALSNGAKSCTFVDNNPKILKILKSNILEISNAVVVNSDYKEFIINTSKQYDIIFLDPPYQLNIITETIKYILNNNLLAKNGIIVCEYENENIETNLNVLTNKKYGSKKITIYENK